MTGIIPNMILCAAILDFLFTTLHLAEALNNLVQ